MVDSVGIKSTDLEDDVLFWFNSEFLAVDSQNSHLGYATSTKLGILQISEKWSVSKWNLHRLKCKGYSSNAQNNSLSLMKERRTMCRVLASTGHNWTRSWINTMYLSSSPCLELMLTKASKAISWRHLLPTLHEVLQELKVPQKLASWIRMKVIICRQYSSTQDISEHSPLILVFSGANASGLVSTLLLKRFNVRSPLSLMAFSMLKTLPIVWKYMEWTHRNRRFPWVKLHSSQGQLSI